MSTCGDLVYITAAPNARNKGTAAAVLWQRRFVDRIAYEVTLVSLISKTPQLARSVSIVKKVLGKVVGIAEWIGAGREGRIIISMQKDDGNTAEVAARPNRSPQMREPERQGTD